jgi:asparagine N-glycosylation enzyme membrane subunit Stt3
MADKKRMNKKGDIPLTVLVVGIVLVCCIAIFSFIFSTIKARNTFVGIGTIEDMNAQLEQRTFSSESPNGLYLEKKATSGFLFWKKEITVFSIEYKFKP